MELRGKFCNHRGSENRIILICTLQLSSKWQIFYYYENLDKVDFVISLQFGFWLMTNLTHSFVMYLFHASTFHAGDRHVRQSPTRVCYTR
jgi:hypothetical protein